MNFRKSVTYFANLGKKLESVDMNQVILDFLQKFGKNERFYRNLSKILFGKFSETYKLNDGTLNQIKTFLENMFGEKNE